MTSAAKSYLVDIYQKASEIDESVYPSESLELTHSQLAFVDDYMLEIYSAAEKKVMEQEGFSSKNLHQEEPASRRFLSNKSNMSEMKSLSRSSNNADDSEDFQAPEISIIEDKTQFLVSKYLMGIRQEGYDDAFSPAGRSQPKEEPKPVIKDLRSTTSSPAQTKKISNEDEYMQAVLAQSFPQESHEDKNSSDGEKSEEDKSEQGKSEEK